MINAKNAELSIGVVYVACRAMTPEEQIQIILKNMGESAIDQFWVYPDEKSLPACDWGIYSP